LVFSSAIFLFLFLPLVLVVYFLTPRGGRNAVLLLASLFFYLWGGGELILLLLLSIGSNYLLGLLVARYREAGPGIRRLCVAGSVLVNVGILAYFKYANFFVDQLNFLAQTNGYQSISWAEVILPIGISFYTFQSMSYVIDLARGISKPLKNPLDFALYVSLFPQLIAGPIVRFHEIEHQIKRREHGLDNFTEGAARFTLGLVKKVIVADTVAVVAEGVFALPLSELTTATVWLGVVAYTIQIYFDFSGYSDMAIGMGRMFGFRFPENFNRPYSALSITDFWRRWHMTLSNWFRDYVYFPLGGSRGTAARTYFNLILVFLLTGLWHGANWTFVVWGCYHGFWLIVERLIGWRITDAGGRSFAFVVFHRTMTLMIVMFGWVVFRARDMSTATEMWRLMLAFDGAAVNPNIVAMLGHNVWAFLILGAAVALLPAGFRAPSLLQDPGRLIRNSSLAFLMLVAFPYALTLALNTTFSPFLYFQF
jgi:alginate O-acetyltransferase complex protein AlgI